MSTTNVLRGLATVNFYASDLEAAAKWYTEFLGVAPYFNVPGYIEFRLGDYQQELGFIDSRYALPGATQTGGAIIHWHVDDLEGTLERLLSLGAKPYLPITDHSQGKGTFVTASVIDPFGNIFGIMTNKHYLDIFEKKNHGN